MKIRPVAFVAPLVALAACAPATSGTTPTTATSAPTTTTVASTVTTAPTSNCSGEIAPSESGPLLSISETSSDAEQISAIGWQSQGGCEVFVIDFATDQGAPATTPPSVEAVLLREPGIVRVAVEMAMTAITDQLVESGLVRQIFVVRGLDQGLFVDLHLSAPALASVVASSSPAQVVISLEPGGRDYSGMPAIGPNVVLISPLEGPVLTPLQITGYSRNFEANTIGRITRGSSVLAQGSTTAADWVETWGEFELVLDPTGSGEADLFVGEQSAEDGSDRGVMVPIELP